MDVNAYINTSSIHCCLAWNAGYSLVARGEEEGQLGGLFQNRDGDKAFDTALQGLPALVKHH